MVSRKLTKELQVILQEDFNQNIEYKKAQKVANAFVSYFELLTKVSNKIRNQPKKLEI